MTSHSAQPGADPVLDQVAGVCLRLVAGTVPRRTVDALKAQMLATPDFPWREVNDRIMAEPVDAENLLRQALRGQRDWILAKAGKSKVKRLKSWGNHAVAFVLSRLIFFVLYTLAAVALLILIKHRWPELDIYRVLAWLQEHLPGVFGRR